MDSEEHRAIKNAIFEKQKEPGYGMRDAGYGIKHDHFQIFKSSNHHS